MCVQCFLALLLSCSVAAVVSHNLTIKHHIVIKDSKDINFSVKRGTEKFFVNHKNY